MTISTCLACFYVSEEAIIRDGLATAIVLMLMLWPPFALVTAIWSRYLRLKVCGSVHVTREQRLDLLTRHAAFRLVSNITTTLTLIVGGLILQVGYMTLHSPLY